MTEEENVFKEFENGESGAEDASQQSEEQEVMPGQSTQMVFLKNPEVGESLVLDLKRRVTKPGRELKNKTTGGVFWTGLEKKDGTRQETILETVNNERFTISSWGLWFSLFGKDAELEKLAVEKGSYEGIKLKITHNLNGKDASTNTADLMKLRGFETLEEAEAHKAKVGEAMKSNKIYSVELVA